MLISMVLLDCVTQGWIYCLFAEKNKKLKQIILLTRDNWVRNSQTADGSMKELKLTSFMCFILNAMFPLIQTSSSGLLLVFLSVPHWSIKATLGIRVGEKGTLELKVVGR